MFMSTATIKVALKNYSVACFDTDVFSVRRRSIVLYSVTIESVFLYSKVDRYVRSLQSTKSELELDASFSEIKLRNIHPSFVPINTVRCDCQSITHLLSSR